MIYIICMLTGAALFFGGFLAGRRCRVQDNGRDIYTKLYAKTTGLYEPVRRSQRGQKK